MTTSATVTIRLDSDLKNRLEIVAKRQQRSKSFVAALALAEYVNLQEAQVTGIKKAMAELDQGESIEHTQMLKWAKSWDTDEELSTPLA